jgi:hypothetical protein
MSHDLQKIIESKRALRCNLAARPVAEKLRTLDTLRERELAIRGPSAHPGSHKRQKNTENHKIHD